MNLGAKLRNGVVDPAPDQWLGAADMRNDQTQGFGGGGMGSRQCLRLRTP